MQRWVIFNNIQTKNISPENYESFKFENSSCISCEWILYKKVLKLKKNS